MLKKILMTTLLLPMFFCAKAKANDSCNSCYAPQWEIYADWLYWKTRSQSQDYATFLIGRTQSDVITIDPPYHSGFRVGVFYQCNDLFYDLSYVRFHQNYSDSTTFDSLNPTRVFATVISSPFVTADWSFSYDTVDLLTGFEFYNNCSYLTANFFGGLKLVFVDQTFTSSYLDPSNLPPSNFNVSQKNNFDGYGVNVGIGAAYDLWNCLNFFTRVSSDILLAKFHRTLYQTLSDGTDTSVTIDTKNQYWNVVSSFNVMLGLAYDYRFQGFCCSNLGIAVGYEFHQYIGVSDWISTPSFSRNLQNLSLDGLFIRLSLGF